MTNKSTTTIPEMPEHPLKVTLISHSDTLGGAAIVTYRLMQALRLEGVDARMIVFTKLSDDPNVTMFSKRARRGFTFMWERFGIAMANGFSRKNLFKVSTASTGLALHRHKWVKEADVIVLGWINQGLLSLKGVRRLAATGKPIVWTMHDMWNLTGICHHAQTCKRYQESCGMCPLLDSESPTDLSHSVWLAKEKLYNSTPIHFVPVSNWLANLCRKSSLMKNRDITVIHNAFPIDSFTTVDTLDLGNITSGRQLILMGAARLDDPIKGLPLAIKALNHIFDNHPEVASNALAVFFGEVRNPSAFDDLRFPYQHIGTISNPTWLRQLYAKGSVVISSSLYETLPGTLIEGQAAGCVPVSFGLGGQSDIIDHKVTGYIARYKDIDDMAQGIMWALNNPIDRETLHESVRQRFAATTIARHYIRLFKSILSKK